MTTKRAPARYPLPERERRNYRRFQGWLSESESEKIERAACATRRSLADYMTFAAMQQADRDLSE